MRVAKFRSGLELTYNAEQSIADFRVFVTSLDVNDPFDLYMIYQYLCIRHEKTLEKSDSYEWWLSRFYAIDSHSFSKNLSQLKSDLGLHSLKDQLYFAHHMIDNFWRIDSF